MKNRSGLTLVECMISVLVLSFAVTVFAALYPLAMRLRSKSENTTRATTLCQQVIEQVRAIPYASLSSSGLLAYNIIDTTPNASPFSITAAEGLAAKLPQATGTLTLTSSTTDLTQVDVTVSWGGLMPNGDTVTVSTLIVNKAVKKRGS
jgi:Tfp pilus assembly protein PilV